MGRALGGGATVLESSEIVDHDRQRRASAQHEELPPSLPHHLRQRASAVQGRPLRGPGCSGEAMENGGPQRCCTRSIPSSCPILSTTARLHQ
eukprot:8761616-Pyramimonas_sp.AAC.1